MIEYLEQLLEEMKNEEAIKVAEQILRSSDSKPIEMLAAQVALARACSQLNQHERAIGPGLVARQMALEMEEWDYYGLACLALGWAHNLLLHHDKAVEYTLEYLANLHRYGSARKHEYFGLYNLGIFSAAAGDLIQAVDALSQSLVVAEATGDQRLAHGVRQGFAEQCMRIGEFRRVPALLAKCSHYLRHHPDTPYIKRSRLFHLKLRAEFALATNRLHRATVICLRGLEESASDLRHLHGFHMILANIFRREGRFVEAFGHATAAQVYANREHRFDLESEASTLCYEVVGAHPEVMDSLENHYLNPYACG